MILITATITIQDKTYTIKNPFSCVSTKSFFKIDRPYQFTKGELLIEIKQTKKSNAYILLSSLLIFNRSIKGRIDFYKKKDNSYISSVVFSKGTLTSYHKYYNETSKVLNSIRIVLDTPELRAIKDSTTTPIAYPSSSYTLVNNNFDFSKN